VLESKVRARRNFLLSSRGGPQNRHLLRETPFEVESVRDGPLSALKVDEKSSS